MTADSAQFEVRAETSDDLDLIHASKNGDVAAFEQLVKRYDRKLLRIALAQAAPHSHSLRARQSLHSVRRNTPHSTSCSDAAAGCLKSSTNS
jgi:hypothetical protein